MFFLPRWSAVCSLSTMGGGVYVDPRHQDSLAGGRESTSIVRCPSSCLCDSDHCCQVLPDILLLLLCSCPSCPPWTEDRRQNSVSTASRSAPAWHLRRPTAWPLAARASGSPRSAPSKVRLRAHNHPAGCPASQARRLALLTRRLTQAATFKSTRLELHRRPQAVRTARRVGTLT